MFDFVAIDFETAHLHYPCSIGIAIVKNSQIKEVKHWLIKPSCYPYFHFFAQKVHGITKEMVMYEPDFEEIWQEISPYLENQILVAHNASFDMSVLKKSLAHYKIKCPQFYYYCTFQISRSTWKENTKFSLDFLCNQEGIVFEHHKADADAEACAKLFLKELEILEVNDFKELALKHKIKAKKLLTHLR